MLRIVFACLFLFALPSVSRAEKRVALVIGNSAYTHAGELANPKNDAGDMAAALRKYGFEVIDGFDLDKASFDRKVREFGTALSNAEAGVFFYAGHGIQVGGQNYLVPVDAKAETADALDFEMVRLDLVQRTMERATATNILFLDACRNNPLARNLARAMGTRSMEIGRGLAPVESGVGTLISFATQPGNVALDGSGRNSPFAGALVRHIGNSADSLGDLLIAVRNDVRKETENKQVPWEHSALTGRFYFSSTTQQTEAPRTESTRPPAAKWPESRPGSPQNKSGGAFDGNWQITWDATRCRNPHGSFYVMISNDEIVSWPTTGKVDKAGRIIFSAPAAVKGNMVHYSGYFTGNSGSGRWAGEGGCFGTFTARRQ
jgi:hypothetical protein